METVLIVGAVAALLALAYATRTLDRTRLQRDFAQRLFHTAAGPRRGADLTVLRFRFERHGGTDNGAGLRTGWWYCEAPGPCWLLVIAQDDVASLTRVETRWVVRELTEARMRVALGRAGTDRTR